jgi:hypothetical protein
LLGVTVAYLKSKDADLANESALSILQMWWVVLANQTVPLAEAWQAADEVCCRA